ncbi:MAG TPA: phosphatase PAP2 family protein [Sphingomonas sp.]|nr:phosphatase PAP2 family protein [Sphingomonas sp.]
MNSAPRSLPSDRFSWLLILAMLGSFVAASARDRFTIDVARAVLPLAGLLLLAITAFVARRAGKRRLEAGATAFLQMTLFTIIGVVLAYALAARGGTPWDARLAMADHALGFDWPILLASLDRMPPLVWVLGLAYHGLIAQMILLIVALSHVGKLATLRIMVAAAILSGFATIMVSAAVPAFGNLFDPAGFQHLWPSVAWTEIGLIAGLRDGSLRTLDLGAMMGIVTFPSFHATLSAIFIWAFRRVPRLAVPGSCCAVLTIAGTPVFGGHYGVDVIAGLLIAPPAIVAARWLTSRSANDLFGKMPAVDIGSPGTREPEARYEVA